MKFIRLNFIIPTAIVIALITVFNVLFFDVLLKKAFIATGEMIFGAKVEVVSLKTSFTHLSLEMTGLKCADRNGYFKNLIDIDQIKFQAKFSPLLRKKIVIDEMSVTGLKWGTERKTSGKLPPKKEKKFEKKKKKDGMFSKFFEGAKNKATSEFNNLPAVDAFAKIEAQTKNFDVNSLINTADLQSLNEINKLSAETEAKYNNYKTKISEYKIEDKIEETKTLINDISKTKSFALSDISASAGKIEKLKENKKELENILKDLNNAKKDLTESVNFTKQIQTMINKDIDSLSSKVALPGLDTRNISRILFGQQWINRTDKIIYYMTLVKKYMPEKKAEKEVKERQKGRDIIFKQKLYPDLLISKINITGTTAKNSKTQGIDFSGFIKNISSSPDMIGSPVTLEIKGNNGSQSLLVEGIFDYRGNASDNILKITLKGLSGSALNIPDNDYLPLINTGNMNMYGTFSLKDNKFLCSADIKLDNIKEKVIPDDTTMKYIVKITNSIKSFSVSAKAGVNDKNESEFNISSDIDKKISEAVSNLFASQIAEVKEKARSEINKMIQEKQKQLEEKLGADKDSLLKDINLKTKTISDITESVNKSVSKPFGKLF
ncbi:MAG: TIGR03545 family protein [Endomicrobiaceae bacterium]|nr:TIGR03545 family protein [Endomicrobiaceae bacterium]